MTGDLPMQVHAGEWRIAAADVPPLPEPWRHVTFRQPPAQPADEDLEEQT